MQVAHSNCDTQRMKGVLDHCLLALIQRRARYGFEIINSLKDLGLLTVGEGSIYPLLSRMRDAGLIEVSDQRSAETGRMRRYYSITASGEEQLELWNREWTSFAGRVNAILGVEPEVELGAEQEAGPEAHT